ncbi:MAG: type II secretion system GspH family protein [Gemmatimonadota bacterium]|nr:type II secretion system GspH family protein [Gemmatimonadota bacterium]
MNQKKSGFTIIELTMALTLLVIAIFSLAQLSLVSINAQTQASLRTTAASLAKSYMEEIKTRDPSTLADESTLAINEWGDSDSMAVFSRSLEIDSLAANLTRVKVVVTYPKSDVPVVMENIIYTTTFD